MKPPLVYMVGGQPGQRDKPLSLLITAGRMPATLPELAQQALDATSGAGGPYGLWYVSGPPFFLVAWRGSERRLTPRMVELAREALLIAWAQASEPELVDETSERRHITGASVVDLPPRPEVLSELGPLVSVVYDGEVARQFARYEHTFDAASRPTLAHGPDGALYVVGGRYTVTPQGITDLTKE